VQWHRAQAEMERWLEEFEMKHVELMRCIQFFNHMHSSWASAATKASNPHYSAFANRQSMIYTALHDDAQTWFTRIAAPHFSKLSEDNLVHTVRDFRKQELGWLTKLAQVSDKA
jgi:hypothetical protein